MAEVKFFRMVGRHRGYTKDEKSDVDEDPQFKGISGAVTISAATTKRREVLKAAALSPYPTLISLWPIEVKLDDGRLKVYADSEDPVTDQPDVRLVAKCDALGLDDDEDLVYTFKPHDVTANGQRQTLPQFSIVAPYIPDSHDDAVDGEIVRDWTVADWLEPVKTNGMIIRQIPDGVEREATAIQFYTGGVPLGEPVDIGDLVFNGTFDSLDDATPIGKALGRAQTQAAGRTTLGIDVTCAGVGNGIVNDRAAIVLSDSAAVAAGLPVRFKAGTYLVSSNLTIASTVILDPGAVLKPANGVTVTLAGGLFDNCVTRIFDHSLGGVVIVKHAEYRPVWWGPIGTVDDSQTWKDMAAAVAAHAASVQLYSGANFGVRVLAPSMINRIVGVELAYCEVDAGRGNVGFVPPAGTTSGVVLTLGNNAQLNGGFFTTNESGHAVTLLYLKGFRAQADKPYVVPGAANSVGIQLGSTSQGSTTPVLNDARVIGVSPPASGSIGIDIQSSDAEGTNIWVARTDVGIRAQRGSGRWSNMHVWGCTTGIGGDGWDDVQVCNLYLDSNLGWGMDVDKSDRARWDGVYCWNNGNAVPSTGAIRVRRTSGSARHSVFTGVVLSDNVGHGMLIDGPQDYVIEADLSSAQVQGGGAIVTTTGVEITANSARTNLVRVGGISGPNGANATTALVDNSTSTVYGNYAASTHLAPSKTTPVDADEVPLVDSADSNRSKRLTWANLKATVIAALASSTVAVRDSLFQLQDAGDSTKKAFINVPSGQTTATAVTHTLPAVSSTLASLAGTEVFTNKTVNLADNTVVMTAAQLSAALTDADFQPCTPKVATADQVVNASAALASWASMSGIPLKASSKYLVRGIIVVAGNQAADAKFRLQASNSVGVTGYFSTPLQPALSATSSTSLSSSPQNCKDIAASAGAPIEVGVITGVKQAVQVFGYIVTGTGASQTLDCHVAQATSDASDTTFYAGSWLEIQEV